MTVDSIATLLSRRAMEHPRKTFVAFDEQRLSYEEALDQVLRVASGFVASGIKRGDRVALMLPNRAEFIIGWFAVSAIGAIMVPINTAYGAAETSYILRHADVAAVICDAATQSVIDKALATIGRSVTVWNVDALDGQGSFFNLRSFDRAEPLPVDRETPVSILYTSGTTGASKGCMHGNGFYIGTGQLFADYLQVSKDDTLLTPLPAFHANAQAGTVMAGLCGGATVVLLDRFHPTKFIASCRSHRATVIFYMGVMPAMLMTLPGSVFDRDHKIRIASGAGMPARLHRDFESRFGFPCIENYGMTETATVSMITPGGDRHVGDGTVGKLVPGVRIRLIDSTGVDVATGQPGELLVQTPCLLLGYFRDVEGTQTALKDGWFLTGDQLLQKEDGFLYFLDRIRDVIRRSGVNISSLEIETILRRHPAVADVAVIGVPDAIRGQEIRVSVVYVDPKSPPKFEELADFVSENLAAFKVPRYWESREELPRTPTLKTRKFLLRTERTDVVAGCWDRQSVVKSVREGSV
jgi:crotonobetaine/carnitine-CoA ligase